MEDSRLARPTYTTGMVVIHRPTAIRHEVIKSAFSPDIVLGEYVVTNIATALSFPRQKTYPFKRPIVRSVVTLIFDVVPDAKGDFEKFIAYFFRIVD